MSSPSSGVPGRISTIEIVMDTSITAPQDARKLVLEVAEWVTASL